MKTLKKEQTPLAKTLDATKENITLDKKIKEVLACKPILARILSGCMNEFDGMSYEEIEACIEGKPDVGIIPVEPGHTNPSKITGSSTEDTVQNEGTITFDIRFYVRIPNKSTSEATKILLNVEAQKRHNPGYDIVTRAIFYAARMISAQLETEFSVSSEDKVKYDNLKKVYSIWICMDVPKELKYSIEQYSIDKKLSVGTNESQSRYDLLSIIMIYLGKDPEASETDNELLKMLSTLLNLKMDLTKKKEKLEKDHGLPMTIEIKKEVEEMCNIGELYFEEFKKEGLEEGRKQGIKEGIKEGIHKERLNSIQRMLQRGRSYEFISEELGCSKEEYEEAERMLYHMA